MEEYYGGIPEIPGTFPCLPFCQLQSTELPPPPRPWQALECTSTFKPCLLLFLHPLDRLPISAGPFLSPFASSKSFLTSITCLGLSCVYLREWIPRHLYTYFLDFAHGWLHTVSNATSLLGTRWRFYFQGNWWMCIMCRSAEELALIFCFELYYCIIGCYCCECFWSRWPGPSPLQPITLTLLQLWFLTSTRDEHIYTPREPRHAWCRI